MTTDADRFKQEIVKIIGAAIRDEGFRRKSDYHVAEFPGVIQAIALQKSTSSTRDWLKVTLNIGVFSKVLAPRILYSPEFAGMLTCQLETRIGELMEVPQDYWWKVASIDEATKCGHEITDLLINKALPLFRGVRSTQGIYEHLTAKNKPYTFGCQEYSKAIAALEDYKKENGGEWPPVSQDEATPKRSGPAMSSRPGKSAEVKLKCLQLKSEGMTPHQIIEYIAEYGISFAGSVKIVRELYSLKPTAAWATVIDSPFWSERGLSSGMFTKEPPSNPEELTGLEGFGEVVRLKDGTFKFTPKST